MTSGQAGPPEQPAGRPDDQEGQGGGQIWNPPPQPPASSAPPPYPSAPPSYPPAPGYAPPPPPGWGGQAPRPMERPGTVRAGIGAFMASLIIGVIAVAVRFTDLDSLVNQALTQTAQAGGQQLSHDEVRAVIIVFGVVELIIVGLQAMFIWFAWNGRNWARIVLWVIGGFGVVSGLFTLFGGSAAGTTGFLQSLGIIQFLIVLAGVVLLALAPSNEWYRYRRWLRGSGQGR